MTRTVFCLATSLLACLFVFDAAAQGGLYIKGKAVRLGTGEPVPGAVVVLEDNELARLAMPYQTVPPVSFPPKDGPLNFVVPISEDGTFERGRLMRGQYVVRFFPKDPTLFQLGGFEKVDLRSGQSVDDLTLYFDVGCAIQGKVVDTDGNPVPNVWVSPGMDPVYNNYLTDQDGEFFMHHLQNTDVEYRLRVNGTSTVVGPIGKGNIMKEVVLTVPRRQPARTAGVAAAPSPPDTSPGVTRYRFVQTDTGLVAQEVVPDPNAAPREPATRLLEGVLVLEDGSPVANTKIIVNESGTKLTETETDEGGRFQLVIRTFGEAALEVPYERRFRSRFSGSGYRVFPGQYVIVEGWPSPLPDQQATRDLRVVVRPPFIGLIIGKTVDEDGAPVNARVKVVNSEGRTYEQHLGPDGEFVVERFTPGPLLLEFTSPGYQARVLERGRDFDMPMEGLQVVLKRGPFPKGVSVFRAVTGREPVPESVEAMPAGQYVRNQEHSYRSLAEQPVPEGRAYSGGSGKVRVRGRVLFPDGYPAEGVEYRFTDVNLVGPTAPTEAYGFTDEEGRLDVEVVSKQYDVWIRAGRDGQGYELRDNYHFGAGQTRETVFILEPVGARSSSVRREVTLKGRVVRADNGGAVAATIRQRYANTTMIESLATMRIHEQRYGAHPEPLVRTEADGSFSIPLYTGGSYLVRALPDDVTLFHEGVLLRVSPKNDDEVIEATIKIAVGGAIEGVLLDHEGKPQQFEHIRTKPAISYDSILTDKEGKFYIHHLINPEIEYELSAGVAESDRGEAKVIVPPVGKGNIQSDVVLQFGPPVKKRLKGVIRGQVVDDEGTPVSFKSVTTPEANYSYALTDGRGYFMLQIRQPGPGLLLVDRQTPFIRTYPSGRRQIETSMEVLSALPRVFAPEDEYEELTVVVRRPPRRNMKAVTVDSSDQPITALARLVHPDLTIDLPVLTGIGAFHFEHAPRPPYLLEFTRHGYQAVVREAGKDFDVPIEDLRVTLNQGAFPDGTDIFEAVTGKPRPNDETALSSLDLYVLSRLDKYREMAAFTPPTQTPEPTQPLPTLTPSSAPDWAMPARGWRVRIVDAEGKPVDEVYYQEFVGRPDAMSHELRMLGDQYVKPGRGTIKGYLKAENGEFRINKPWIVLWTEDSAYTLFRPPEAGAEQPITLQLKKGGIVTLEIKDFKGNPVHPAGAAENGNFYSNRPGFSFITNEAGQIVLERMPAGSYSFGITRESTYPRVEAWTYFDVKPGDNLTIQVAVGEPDPGTAAGILAQWKKELGENLYRRDREIWRSPAYERYRQMMAEREARRLALAEALDEETRRRVGEELVRQIDRLPDLFRSVYAEREPQFLVTAMMMLRHEPALEAWVRVLRRVGPEDPMRMSRLYFLDNIVDAMVELGGDALTPAFAELARDPETSPPCKTAALIALGKIGSEASVRAFAEIRDAAYALPGAPQRKTEYTHAEKMAEALEMVLYVIPYQGRPPAERRLAINTSGATVSEDYLNGGLGVGDLYRGHTGYSLKRFGAEWLVVAVGGTVIS